MASCVLSRTSLASQCINRFTPVTGTLFTHKTKSECNNKHRVRHASSAKKELRRKLRDETVFQYASKNTKRSIRVYVWGSAGSGALGIRRFNDPAVKNYAPRLCQHVPARLEILDKLNLHAEKAACGYGYSIVLCKDRDKHHVVYGTGINTDSQIGFHARHPGAKSSLDYVVEASPLELPLMYPDKTRVEHVACGRAHTIICTDNEGLITLGHNSYGQCGRPIVEGEDYRNSQLVNKVDFPHKIVQVECGQDHTLLLTDEGQLFSFGLASDGQTGQGHYSMTYRPTLIKGDIAGEKIVQVSSRADCVLAVSEKGDMFGWGNNEYNQLSFVEKEETQVNSPRHLPFPSIGKITMAAAAGSSCALLNEQGNVYVWGYGILGKGPNVDESPTPIDLPPALFGRNELHPDSHVTSISCGINNFAAITNHGELYTWGNNKSGQLGLGNAKDQYFPFKVLVPAEVLSVSCGVDHTVVIAKGFV